MTREIKFRGKSLDGIWEYGELHLRCNHPHIHNLIGAKIYIDQDTVGQFTGLYDKNGKEIYEGDIVKCTGNTNETLLFYVDWHKHLCKFYLSFGEEQKVNDTKKDIFEMMRMGYNYEVIGNVHDNFNLLHL